MTLRSLLGKLRQRHGVPPRLGEQVFQPLLAGLRRTSRGRRLAALVIATDVLVWKLLRLDMQLSRPQAERTVLEIIEP